MNSQKIFITVTIIGLIILVIIIDRLISTSQDTTKTVVNPSVSSKKISCSTVRTPCDPNNANSCSQVCNDPEEMMCVNLDQLQPSDKNVNGGGYVCLPKSPDTTKCDQNKGGAYVWTGYGFTDQQDWSCLCTRPEYFNGPTCDNQNPSFCSGGTLDMTKPMGNDMCICPPGTKKMFREYGNLPFCASTDPQKGGGDQGLYGNIESYPSWVNVYYDIGFDPSKPVQDRTTWAQAIANELYKQNPTSTQITNIQTILNKYPKVYQLNQDIVNNICGLSDVGQTELCRNNIPQGFNPNYEAVVSYTYYDNAYLA